MLRIRELREINNLTQADVGKILNCNQSAVGKYERGDLEINIDSLITLSKFFGVSVDYLLGLEDDFGGKVAGSNSPRSTLSGVPAAPELSNEEKKLIKFYRAIGETARVAIYTTAESFFNQLPEEKKVIFR